MREMVWPLFVITAGTLSNFLLNSTPPETRPNVDGLCLFYVKVPPCDFLRYYFALARILYAFSADICVVFLIRGEVISGGESICY